MKKVGEETVFVGRLNHPFAGWHFAQFLNSVSPFADQDLGGIMGDVDLPIQAERGYQVGKDKTTSLNIRLHERHLEDPRVGPAYKRFVLDHVDAWLRALRFISGWQVFEKLQRTRFINSQEEVACALSLEWQEIFANIEEGQNASRISQIEYTAFRTPYQLGAFRDLSLEERAKRIDSFLNRIGIQRKHRFAVELSLERRQILVDLETHRIRSNKSDPYDRIGKGEVKFADNRRDVVISDDTETKIVITPTGQNSDRFSWKVIDYQFPRDYISHSLYPVIAWRKDENGQREFLTQQEARPQVAELGLKEGEQGDTKLGEIAVAYFARDIIKNWQTKMTLVPLEGTTNRRQDDFEQPMMGGQMPAWVAMEQNKTQLLRSETSVLALLER